MDPSWAPLVSAIGVVVSATVTSIGWWLNQRNARQNLKLQRELNAEVQREALKYKVKADARVDVIKALREYQTWCSRLAFTFEGLQATADFDDLMPTKDPNAFRQTILLFFPSDAPKRWLELFRETDAIFPRIRAIRQVLSDREQALNDAAFRTLTDFWGAHTRAIGIRNGSAMAGPLREMAQVVADLSIHVQRAALESVMGETARPDAVVEGFAGARAVELPNGELRIDPLFPPLPPLEKFVYPEAT